VVVVAEPLHQLEVVVAEAVAEQLMAVMQRLPQELLVEELV